MPKGEIPEEVQRFLAAYISSVSQLETLLLLYENGEGEWTVVSADRELRIGERLVGKHFEDLHRRNLFTVTAAQPLLYRYAPASSEVDQAVRALATTYKERRVSLIRFMFSEPFRILRARDLAPNIEQDENKD